MEGYHLLYCQDFAVAYCNCNIATSGTNATANFYYDCNTAYNGTLTTNYACDAGR